MPSSPSPPAPLPHLPALDGLRGLAVLGVMLFHDGRLTGGYLGVDLFFVLSGYLITGILLAEHRATGTVSLRAFWVRRARRLFPALLALVPAVALHAVTLATPAELGRIRGDGLATLAYVANWRAIAVGRGYWDFFSAPSPLEHTWSLAIEEQFYVLWPLLTLAVLRLSRGSARALFVVAATLAVASAAALALFYGLDGPSRAYQGTDTRGAALLLGAALACALSPAHTALQAGMALSDSSAPAQGPSRALDVAGVIAAAALALAWARLGGESHLLYNGGLLGTEVAVLVLIACARADRRSLVARALALRPLTAVGLISYGLYLWHWPVFVVLTPARTGLGPAALTAARFAVTFAIASLSYRLLEQPIRKRGLPWGKPIVIVPAAMALAALAIVLSTRGARTPEQEAAWIRALPGGLPAGARKVLVLGDSVAVTLGERMRAVQGAAAGGPFVIGRGIGSCSLLHDQLPTRAINDLPHVGGDCDTTWVSDAAEVRPEVTLVMLGGGFLAPSQIDGAWRRPCDEGWKQAYRLELTRDLAALREHGGRRIVVLAPDPVERWARVTSPAIVGCFNDALRAAAAASPGVEVIDLRARLCPQGTCAVESGGAPIRPDGLHFLGPGAEETARWMLGEVMRPLTP